MEDAVLVAVVKLEADLGPSELRKMANLMKNEPKVRKIFHAMLRPAFGICLFLSQFTSERKTLFTDNLYLLFFGILLLVGGILFWISSSLHLRKAAKSKEIAISGPFKYVRHPIYVGIYILSIGLGIIFFAWFWFIVMLIFIPFWYMESKGEEKEMIKLYGQKYTNYQKRTGMFLPKMERCWKPNS